MFKPKKDVLTSDILVFMQCACNCVTSEKSLFPRDWKSDAGLRK